MRQIDTTTETTRLARESTKYTLRDLVGKEACQWDDEKLHQEAWRSADIILRERQNHDIRAIVHDRAMTLKMSDMPRLPIMDLNIPKEHTYQDNETYAVLEMSVWPYETDKFKVWEVLERKGIDKLHTGYISQARDEAATGVVKKLRDFDCEEVCDE